MKKTVIFLIFEDIKRHNSKYTGRLLIIFGHNNIGSLGFGMQSVLFENLFPFTSSQKNLSTEKNYLTFFDNSGLGAIKKLHFRLRKKKF